MAGTGKKGYSGDGGPATAADMNEPYEVRFDRAGNMYVVEMQNHIVRRISAEDGTITTIAGNGKRGYGGDNGPATEAQLNRPHSIVVAEPINALDDSPGGAAGEVAIGGGVYIADIGNHRIRRVDLTTGRIESIAGSEQRRLPVNNQLARGQPILGPRALYLTDNALWIALREGHSVWRLDRRTGRLRHVAGTGKKGFGGDGGPALKATFNGPKGIAVGPQGRIYVVDTENQAIRRIDPGDGSIATVAGFGPEGRGGAGDGGPAVRAQMDRPHGICVGSDGSIYIGDTLNHRVRRVVPESDNQADSLRQLDTNLLPAARPDMLADHYRGKRDRANRRSTRAWRELQSEADWSRFARERLARLERSLGDFPTPPATIAHHVSGEQDGPGFRIQNVVWQSRPGLWATANLYLPQPLRESMPGILICHSHHTPKEHRELQHMGMTWARRGAVVLVPDQLGHGERREHDFRSADDFDRSFRVSRQDYYFRYDTGIQLHLIGESLIGQIVWDLRRCVDLLLAQSGVDAKRIALLGAVAGGGDPAAVAASLDSRIAVAAPFNFGGPQPETRFPLPEDADDRFNYAGSGSWESTRNLRRSAADGFLPWVIVGGILPRKLIYAHEFKWDRERDPVWRRLEQLDKWTGSESSLDWVRGFGAVTLRPPNASHCTHIGAHHRERIHAALKKWFELAGSETPEYLESRDRTSLRGWTPAMREKLQPKRLHRLLDQKAKRQLAVLRDAVKPMSNEERRPHLASGWEEALGSTSPTKARMVKTRNATPLAGGGTLQGFVLEVESGIEVPVVLLLPERRDDHLPPVVVAFAQCGKAALIRERAAAFAGLLEEGVAICLPDVRGTGETRPDAGRARRSWSTSLSSSALMFDGTLLGERLRDVRTVLAHLRQRDDVDGERLAFWGDSLARPNDSNDRFAAPRGIDGRPRQSEPLGGLLALLAAMHEPNVKAIYVRGGLTGFQSVLDSPYVYIPHDVVVPGALRNGDVEDIVATLAPTPLMADQWVDGWNRLADEASLKTVFASAAARYEALGVGQRLNWRSDSDERPHLWLAEHLR